MPEKYFITRDPELRFLIVIAGILTFLLGTSYAVGHNQEKAITQTNEEIVAPVEEIKISPFTSITLKAKSAYVYDARTKSVIFAHNENTRMPLASLTKLMTALVAKELSPAYGTVTVSREALMKDGDNGLLAGEKWALNDLIDFSLIVSSNDGMHAVALALGALGKSNASSSEIVNDFVSKMNIKAAELNLKNTYFWNETGLDESDVKGGAYGTARDVVSLMEYIITYHPEMLNATREVSATLSSLNDIKHVAINTNDLAGSIPGLLASKTGYTNTAGGNLALAFDPEIGRPIIIAILGSTEKGRFEDARKLIEVTLEYLKQ